MNQEQTEPETYTKPDNKRTKRIIYITIILVFVFLIAWMSGIVGKILNI